MLHRHLFSRRNFPRHPTAKFSTSILNLGDHRLIKDLPYDRLKIYSVIVDVESYPQFIPYCLSTKIINKSSSNQNNLESEDPRNALVPEELQVLTTVGYKGFITDYHSHVICTPLERVEVIAKPSSTFSKLKTTWKLSKTNNSNSSSRNMTQVELDLSFKFNNPIHEYLLTDQFVWDKFSSLVIKAFEHRLSSLD